MAVNWLQNWLITNNESLFPVLFFISVVYRWSRLIIIIILIITILFIFILILILRTLFILHNESVETKSYNCCKHMCS